MVEYAKEETGHHEWVLNDIGACGFDPQAARASTPGLATEIMVAYAYDIIQRGNPVGFLGMVLVLEGTSAAVAMSAAQALSQSLGLPRQAFTYLASHGALDIEHTAYYATLVNRLDDPRDRADLTRAARVFYRLYGAMFDALDRVRLGRASGANARAAA
jgi:pyrroloquinoline quinone (PQQ) biosynthesis protein C